MSEIVKCEHLIENYKSGTALKKTKNTLSTSIDLNF